MPDSQWIEVTPHYGRTYDTQAAVRKDWDADKDFFDPASRRAVNKSDAERYNLKVVVRYGRRLEKVFTVKSA